MSESFRKQESIERKRDPEAYFSVSHILNHVRVADGSGNYTEYNIVVRGKDKNDKPKYQAFGGGAKLTPKGISLLQKQHGEHIRFRKGEESNDARFYIELPERIIEAVAQPDSDDEAKSLQNAFTRETLEPFLSLETGNIEETIERELYEELIEASSEIAGMLREGINISYVGAVSPVQWDKPGSPRADGAVLYQRIFHLFDITLTKEQFDTLISSQMVRVLSENDVQRIYETSASGKALAEMEDGSYIAENVFPTLRQISLK